MEASCLFTVAAITGTAAAAAFVVSDVLHGEQWEPRFGSPGVLHGVPVVMTGKTTNMADLR